MDVVAGGCWAKAGEDAQAAITAATNQLRAACMANPPEMERKV
jgi:hypothetical protein